MSFGNRGRLERALTGHAQARDVGKLVAGLRDDPRLRAAYDRGALAMRTLERAAVSEVEIDWVERWLEADGTLGSAAAPTPTRWLWIGVAALAAGAAVLALRPAAPGGEPDDPLQARGMHGHPQAGWLAVSVLCDDGRGAETALVEASSCSIDASIGFATRIDARHHGGEHFVLFGVDEGGELQYYLPTPDVAAPTLLARDRWIPLDRAVRLRVNHRPGRVRVFAGMLAHPPTLDALEDAAAALAREPASAGDEIPWIERLGPGHRLTADCAFGRCLGAELEFRVDAATPTDPP
jgi:hypothetical protein